MTDNREQELTQAFQMMWGNYHEPVRLIHRSFRVVAGNAAYLNMSGQIGEKCNATNPELHRGCQAMASLKEKKTKFHTTSFNGVEWISYWVPVDGCDDYFVHFTNSMNEFLEKVASPGE